MHAAGMDGVSSAVLSGQTIVLHDTSRKFDPAHVLGTAERERVGPMTIWVMRTPDPSSRNWVGDATDCRRCSPSARVGRVPA